MKCFHEIQEIRGLTPILFLLALPAQGAVRGDTGWSDDGRLYGFCRPDIVPDSAGGCMFFNRENLEWTEVGRRQALLIWRVWQPAPETTYSTPLLPVYPLDEKDREEGVVRLDARIAATDDVTGLWTLHRGESPDEAGSVWDTVFDYSPDGTWLAAGALRVDFSDSANHLHVIVRPVSHWLVLAEMRAGLDRLGRGDLEGGLGSLAAAGSRLDGLEKGRDPIKPQPPKKKRAMQQFIDEETETKESWIDRTAILKWSGDGKKLCSCDAWEDSAEGNRAACRWMEMKKGDWTPIVAEKIKFMCLDPPKPQPDAPEVVPPVLWVDWGVKPGAADTYRVVVYWVDPKKGRLGAVMEDEVRETIKANWMEGSIEPLLYPVGLPSPRGNLIALGFAREASDHSSLQYRIVVDTAESWKLKAEEDMRLFKKAKPKIIEKIQGIF
jgi:hypothetical protein